MANLTGVNGKVKIGSTFDILAITNDTEANIVSVQLDTAAHGLVTGDRVIIAGIVGMTDLNGYRTVLDDADDIITISLDTAQSYSSGGTVVRHVPVISWKLSGKTSIYGASDSESDDWEENVAGKKSFDVTMEGYCKEGASLPQEGDLIAFALEIDENNYFTGDAVVSSVDIIDPANTGDNVTFTITAKGTGAKVKTLNIS